MTTSIHDDACQQHKRDEEYWDNLYNRRNGPRYSSQQQAIRISDHRVPQAKLTKQQKHLEGLFELQEVEILGKVGGYQVQLDEYRREVDYQINQRFRPVVSSIPVMVCRELFVDYWRLKHHRKGRVQQETAVVADCYEEQTAVSVSQIDWVCIIS